ncbi:mediator of RNA polymerase II transcription subunit 13 isoform X1 [Anopheles funestus]|uniref:mediator of RNA polymerase II transcription subunit 13 isoform X1 n=1 Tax=Anopheles funestus TaxID=62324 RepID=UPI0020C657F7|nr:mediator of RNA polymerase II transcription subunit 13 isoform X1 [Anopheles funestus]XP_049299049.1 mediator of RNA polymerase II transcription subunit 13 isoform X1 [Anopheles funestus]XP_049299050.1 mediator of RNA polymerase II transcription subunit 13 isoform X1 [Anopheles funestus]XP_049299051.1 mediator of RNA polymerase II transcription subunit 13 isoform X1 [Anopheles funestus]XP_049299052.1 mediator of RNA polymerase II transcription subunit 13 isoform X1 [Anopheles funestus]XP_04
MTHQNHQTNGASLEDCHTNFFALTDLCGIRWRQLVLGERPNAAGDPLDDPVVRSYSKCLAVDILCVWRRVVAPKPKPKPEPDPSNMFDMSIPGTGNSGSVVHPPLSLTAAKELWIFWYGEEPDLTDLVAPELLNSSETGDKGSWENGLSYECRSLLFKALHNVIERCLLSRGFVRIGRWFVHPSSNSEGVFGKSSHHASFSFTFFVHGDSTVCTSMDIREHPPVRLLTMRHLEQAQQAQQAAPSAGPNGGPGSPNAAGVNGGGSINPGSPGGTAAAGNGGAANASATIASTDASEPREVILAPFGLAGTLTGQSYKASDPHVQKMLDDWSAFYPISNKLSGMEDGSDNVPPMVEILVGKLKMRYPTKYVLVADMDDWTSANDTRSNSSSNSNNSTSSNNSSSNQTATPVTAIPSIAASVLSRANNASERSSGPINATSNQPAAGNISSNSSNPPTARNKDTPNESSSVALSPTGTLRQRNHHKSMMTPPLTVPESPSNDLGNPLSMSSALINKSPAVILPERVWQDCIMHASPSPSPMSSSSANGSTSAASNGSQTISTTPGSGVTIKTEPKDTGSSSSGSTSNTATSSGGGDENSSGAANGVDANGNSSVWEISDPTVKVSCCCIKCCKRPPSSSSSTSTSSSSASSTASGRVSQHQQQQQQHTIGAAVSSSCSLSTTGSLANLYTSNPSPKSSYSITYPGTGGGGGSNRGEKSTHGHQYHHYHHHHGGGGQSIKDHHHHHHHHHRPQRIAFHKRPPQEALFRPGTKPMSLSAAAVALAAAVAAAAGSSSTAANAAATSPGAVSSGDSAADSLELADSCLRSNQNCATNSNSGSGGTNSTGAAAGSTTPYGGPPSYCRNPMSIGESHPLPSEGSPASAAPSPMQPSSVSQPTSVPSGDQLITMSPHPPASNNPRSVQPGTPCLDHLDKNTPAPTPTDQHDSKSINASPYHTPSHPGGGGGGGSTGSSGNGNSTEAQQQQQQSQSNSNMGNSSSSSSSGSNSSSNSSSLNALKTSPRSGTLSSGIGSLKVRSESSLGAGSSIGSGGGVPMTPSIHSVYSSAHQTAMANNLASKRESILQMLQSLKRPSLFCKDYETLQSEDIPSTSQLLYDYTCVDAWMNHPVKRMRLAMEENRLVKKIRNLDLYANEHSRTMTTSFGVSGAGMPGSNSVANAVGANGMLMKGVATGDSSDSLAETLGGHNGGGGGGGVGACDNGTSNNGSCQPLLGHGQIKMELGCDGSGGGRDGAGTGVAGSGMGGANGTPDRNGPSSGNGDGALLGEHEIKKEKEEKGSNFLTDQDLQPSIDDLNQIFDDGGPFNDDPDLHNTPPGSNKSCSGSGGFSEEGKRFPSSNHHSVNSGMLSPKELSQMFPTPPSIDPHPNSSPGGGGCLSDGGIAIDTLVDLQMSLSSGAGSGPGSGSNLPNLGSPQEEPIDDWSFVFLPPPICPYVGSSKYAPLPSLPSQLIIPQIPTSTCTGLVYKSTRQKQKEQAAAEREKQKLREQAERDREQQQQLQQDQQQNSQSDNNNASSTGASGTTSGIGGIGGSAGGLGLGLLPIIKQELGNLTIPQPLSTPNSLLGGLNNLNGSINHPYSNPPSQGAQSQPHSRPPSVNSLPGGIIGSGAGMLSPSPAGAGASGGLFHPGMGGIPVPLRQGMSPISPATPGGSMRVPTPQGGSCPLPYPSPLGGAAAGSPNPMGSLNFRRTTPLLPPPPYDVAIASPANSVATPSSYHSKQFPLDGVDNSGGPGSNRGPMTPSSTGGGPLGSTVNQPLSSTGGGVGCGTGVGTNGTSGGRSTNIETNALLVNILLYDTALNIFRDHNFKSCTLCVCNAGTKCVGNIRGADSGLYLALPGTNWMDSVTAPAETAAGGSGTSGNGGVTGGRSKASALAHLGLSGGSSSSAFGGMLGSPAIGSSSDKTITINTDSLQNGYLDEDPIDCQCGFSAVVNRRMAHRAGLFYEDEMEITGMAEDPAVHKKSSLFEFLNGTAKAIKMEESGSGGSNGTLVATGGASATGGNGSDSLPLTLKVMDLLREQCSVVQSSSNSIHRAVNRYRGALFGRGLESSAVHLLEYVDANDVISLALEQGRLQAINESKMEVDQQQQSSSGSSSSSSSNVACSALVKGGTLRGIMNVHKWPFLRAGGPKSNQDIVRIMKSMQPLLQDAFHKRCTTRLWDAPYTIQGPLTWRQFHRLAGRGTGQCEPQPIPSLIVGYEKDWLSLAPYALHYWDKLLLEPYSYPRDVAYVAIVPDNDYVVAKVRTYFKELSTTYEMCKLGRHTPIKGWDGILRVGSQRVLKETQNSNLDEWFTNMGVDQQRKNGSSSSSGLNELLRLYAQTCQQQLAPYLSKVPSDKSLLDPPESHHHASSSSSSSASVSGGASGSSSLSGGSMNQPGGNSMGQNRGDGPGQSPMPPPPPSTPDSSQPGDKAPNTPKFDHDSENRDQLNTSSASPADGMRIDDDGKDPPHIVLYIVEPFTCGSDSPDVERLACLSLLRCYSNILNAVPDSIRSNISVQIISLESILELGRNRNRLRLSDHMRCLALSVFSQSRKYLAHMNTVKSLTGFGTAANAEQFIKRKDDKNRVPYRLYTPPYVLARSCEKSENTESFGKTSMKQQCSIMYCSYCLSEDQSWLLAVATDDRGEFLETVTINIDIPNRGRRKRASARRYGLQKLMDFILGLISQTVQPWRLVVGRIGRIGHGELKGWSWLLSKPNLQRASKHLKDICEQCSLMHPIAVPSILSACLVTLEPDSDLRVMSDQFTPDERFSQRSMQSPLSTPQDATCTHILVFPTSAKAQSAQASFSVIGELDLGEDLNMVIMDGDDDDDGINMMDVFKCWDDLPMQQINMPHSRPGSPSQFEGNQQSPGESGSKGAGSRDGYGSQDSEEVGLVLQQPLAIGYLVSTAPTGRMPEWFWSSCPHMENVCPVFLRTALHLHSPTILQNTDDPLQQNQSSTEHPLDSNITADVLRYVLEGYNLLSWLAMDSNTHDRLSCLPIHVQVLMQLYHMTAALA